MIMTTRRAQSMLSTVHRGVAFEERALTTLSELSMSLRRVGGRNDGGVDLQGWWWLPASIFSDQKVYAEAGGGHNFGIDLSGRRRIRIRILAQCKSEKKKLGPNFVREMEGVLHRYIVSSSFKRPHPYSSHIAGHDSSTDDVETGASTLPAVAVLVSASEFTKAAVLSAMSSSLPILLIHLPDGNSTSLSSDLDASSNITIGSAVWNAALGGTSGLFNGQLQFAWEIKPSTAYPSDSRNFPRQPLLQWKGEKLESWVQALVSSSQG